ncbi:unnamed protein product [Didymodactylos carnosus]|uniref:Uncharacterized protein n=1 Tax=Didymodactylos carnosus TaxID=1234261 RepID=A0A8S2FJP6_9BILA|nr:unnamed protein product [Didymodactylos carnosus]CAF4276703.1 unnamed protein product [Didymodactylos carnosus]
MTRIRTAQLTTTINEIDEENDKSKVKQPICSPTAQIHQTSNQLKINDINIDQIKTIDVSQIKSESKLFRPYDWDNLPSTKSYSTKKHNISLKKVKHSQFESLLKSNKFPVSHEICNIPSSDNQQYCKNNKECHLLNSLGLVLDNNNNNSANNGCTSKQFVLVQHLTNTKQSGEYLTVETDTSNILSALNLASTPVSTEDSQNNYQFDISQNKSPLRFNVDKSDRKRKLNNSKSKISSNKHFRYDTKTY